MIKKIISLIPLDKNANVVTIIVFCAISIIISIMVSDIKNLEHHDCMYSCMVDTDNDYQCEIMNGQISPVTCKDLCMKSYSTCAKICTKELIINNFMRGE